MEIAMKVSSMLLISFALLAAGCAATDTREVAEERDYQTGSRLPRKQYPAPGARVWVPDASDTPAKPLPGPRAGGG
jgi:hypothetical protein